MSENISEDLEDWIINSLIKLGVTIPKLKKLKAQVYKQNHKVPPGKVFGVMLSQQIHNEQSENDTIPKFLLEATNFLIPHLDHKCLFRKRGQDSRIKKLRERIEAGGTLDETVFVDDVATLIKAWLRELPVPVIPNEFHDFILSCHKLAIETKTSVPLLQACSLLPKPHLNTLKYLLNFLARVAWNSVANCMDSQSLSIVFGPNLIRGDCRLVKNEKASAQLLKEKEGGERNLLQWMIEHADEISKLPESLQLLASLGTEDEVLTRKKRRKSMSGFTELMGCKIKKMVTNQDKTPALSNSSKRKSVRKSQRGKGKFFVHDTDQKKLESSANKTKNSGEQREDNRGKTTSNESSKETTPKSSCCSPIALTTITTSSKPKEKSNLKVNTRVVSSQNPQSLRKLEKVVEATSNRTESFKRSQEQIIRLDNFRVNSPVTRSQSQHLESSFKNHRLTIEVGTPASMKRRSKSAITFHPVVMDNSDLKAVDRPCLTPVTRSQSQSMLKRKSSTNLRTSMKRRSQSAVTIIPVGNNLEVDKFDVTPITNKMEKMNINSSIRRSGSVYRSSKVTKSSTLRRGRPNSIKTGLSATRKPKVRSNSSVSYKNGSLRRIKVARRSRSSTNFEVTGAESDSSNSLENSGVPLDLRLNKDGDEIDLGVFPEENDAVKTPKQSEERVIKKKLYFSPSFEGKSTEYDSIGNELYRSLGFSPPLDGIHQNTEKSFPLTLETLEDHSPSSEELKDKLENNENDVINVTPALFNAPTESPIPLSGPRTRSTTNKTSIQSSTPANLNRIQWQDAAQFAFSKSQDSEDDIQGSKRDSIIKLREMNAGKVLASIHLYNAIEKVHSVKPSPGPKLATFERNSVASKSVRDRKELFKDAQGFLVPRDLPSSIKRPNIPSGRLLSRTPDSPLPRNWHKKKNASADLLYVN